MHKQPLGFLTASLGSISSSLQGGEHTTLVSFIRDCVLIANEKELLCQ